MSKALQKKVNEFISKAGEAPAQKTKEWYQLKAKTIGGSEVATVLGINPFRSVKALIAEKIGLNSGGFSGNIATRWGTIFENITREWTQKVLLLDEKIEETGSLPGIIERQRYSPDGLGVVALSNENDELDYYIVLFEFKSPLRSLPDGKIPKYYVPQIQTGMLTIPMVELSIFVNNAYRKCHLKDIGFTMEYDSNFHDGDAKKKKTKKQVFTEVLACGVICFYQTKSNYELGLKLCGYGSDSESEDDVVDIEAAHGAYSDSTGHDMTILMNSRESPIDFGFSKTGVLNRLFELCEEKRIGIMYYPMVLNQEAVNELEFIQTHKKEKTTVKLNPKKIVTMQLNQFTSHCEDNELLPVGFLPWKLFKSDIIIDTPQENWLDTIKDPILDTLKKIDEISSAENPEEKFYEYFPDKNIIQDEIILPEDDLMKPGNDDDNEVVI